MFSALKQLLDRIAEPAVDAAGDTARLHLATAVLLVEVMRADRDLGAAEHEAVLDALRREFALAGDALDQLVELAHLRSRDATDFHEFTSALNAMLDEAQKVRIVEAMWRVAYADGHLEAHERHVLWRVADLLHLPHPAYIAAKLRAKAALGLGDDAGVAGGGRGDGG